MKISDVNQSKTLHYINQAAQQKGVHKKGPEESAKGTSPSVDRVDLSIQSREMRKIQEVLAATPDVRTERVEALKKQIEEGTYQVDSNALAEKMIRESLFELNK